MFKTFISAFLLSAVLTLSAFAQEKQSILTAPENWKSELISFPLEFAPSIGFSGIEL